MLKELPHREHTILEKLRAAAGGIVSRTELGDPGGSRAVDMAISRLRKHLGPAGPAIVTVRGRGYRLVLEGEQPGLNLGWAELHLPERRLRFEKRHVTLTGTQARLLERLAESPGKLVSRSELLRAVWGAGVTEERLDLALHRLRKRIEDEPSRPRYLVSVRGRGVVLLDSRPAADTPMAPPAQRALLGREASLASALALLGQQRRALLHGPPGVGKSALASQLTRRWLGAAPGRGWLLVDLHDVGESAEGRGRLAGTLGMESVDRDDLVARSLDSRGELLLVLDGELPSWLQDRASMWLSAAPRLRIVVATRAAQPGWPLVPLEGLDEGPGLQLLEQAAGRSLYPGGERLVRRAEGNPLALELLGRSLEHRSIEAVEQRLALPLAPLRAAWRSCLDELGEEERAAALASSLLRRPFDPEDLAAIAQVPEPRADALVARLLERSILHRTSSGRVELPSTARELLQGDLRQSGALTATRERVRARCHAVVSGLAEAIPHAGGAALDALQDRWSDLSRALDVDDDGPPEDAGILAVLAREAAERLPRSRREDWAEDLLAAAERPDLPGGVRAECLRSVHALRWSELKRADRQALLGRALALVPGQEAEVTRAALAAELASVVAFSFGEREARQLLRAHPLPEGVPAAERIRRDRHVGRLAILAGRPHLGVPRLQEAVRLAELEGLPLLEARCRMALGQALSASATGSETAEHHLRQAMALTRAHGLPEQNARATLRLAQHLLRLGLRKDASSLLHEALQAAVRGGLPRLEEQCSSALGYLLIGQQDLDGALENLDRAVELSQEAGGRRALFVALSNRGLARALAGQASTARDDLRVAREAGRGTGGWYEALGLAYQALAELLDTAPREASSTVGEALELLSELEHPDAAPLAEALEVLRGLALGSLAREEARAWVQSWSGSAEVEGVVLGLDRALVT